MTQSVTGTGPGDSGKVTTKELSTLANGPSILVSGQVELAEEFMVNPPTPTATVTLPTPLPGGHANYVVLLTGVNTGTVYVATVTNNDDGDFSEFRILGDEEGTCNYLILKIGSKPKV